MSRILLTTDSYHFSPTANGICVEEIADELKKSGHEVHILCFKHQDDKYEDNINGIHVHRIRMDIVNKLRFLYEKKLSGWKQTVVKKTMMAINRTEAILFLHWYPMRSPLFCERYKKKVEELQKQYNFDIIVASYNPFVAAYTLAMLDKELNVKKCLYALDTFTNHKKRIFLSREYQDKKGWIWEQKIYARCDLILNLKCHENHHKQSRYDIYRDKMRIVDIPHMIKFDTGEKDVQPDRRKMLYAGNFYKDIAGDVFNVLSEIILSNAVTLEIYGRNDCESLQKYAQKEVAQKIIFGGFIDRDEVLKKESQADILLSIGDPGTDCISCKIFEYIAFGGKVLHLYKGSMDPNYRYFDKYKNACCINLELPTEESKKKIADFINAEFERIPFEEIQELYRENLPAYTTRYITNNEGKYYM